MTEGSDTAQFLTWMANWQVTARKNETGLSPVVWNSNYLFGNFYVGQVTHLTTSRSAPGLRPTAITCTRISKVILVSPKCSRAHFMTNYLSANQNISFMSSKKSTNHNSVKPAK